MSQTNKQKLNVLQNDEQEHFLCSNVFGSYFILSYMNVTSIIMIITIKINQIEKNRLIKSSLNLANNQKKREREIKLEIFNDNLISTITGNIDII